MMMMMMLMKNSFVVRFLIQLDFIDVTHFISHSERELALCFCDCIHLTKLNHSNSIAWVFIRCAIILKQSIHVIVSHSIHFFPDSSLLQQFDVSIQFVSSTHICKHKHKVYTDMYNKIIFDSMHRKITKYTRISIYLNRKNCGL